MERTGRPTATAFHPLPSHINTAIQDPMTANGVHTPSYGGVVSTGVEWDYIVHPDGSRSRAPSRSPNRAAASAQLSAEQQQQQLPHPMRSVSNPLDATTSDMLKQPLPPVPTQPAASSAHAFTSHPSSHPHEPTISEEASAYVGRSVSQSAAHSQARQAPSSGSRNYAASGSPQPQQSHKSAAAALAPVNTATGAPYAAAPPPASSSKRRQYRQVGDWILQKTLGQGSMGKVKLGINVQTQEKCAVKIVPRHREDPSKDASGRSKDESKEIRTVREASISLLLHHPYICGMRDFLVHQNHYYMVFEYIDGGQMLDYIIAHGRLRERAARKFARQIASALDYCHHNNIVHRDLKIENILISNNGNIKIIDFGLSNLYSPHRHLSTFCGSLYFAAPELLNAKLYTGPEVDIWSFGIVLYVLVCGKVPFDDQSMPALHAKIKRGLAEYPAWLSNDCKALLQRMLNTNPQERATLQEVLNHPWMTKGYDGRPDSHLIIREPLRADDLDMDVIKRMQGFTFGTPEEIHENLTKILTSEQYLRCVQTWEASRDRSRGGANGSSTGSNTLSVDSESPKKKRFSGFDLKRKIFKEEKKAEEGVQNVKEPLDPSSGFDPLISIYFLAREKKERSKVYGNSHFADSGTSVDASSMQPIGYGAALPSLPAPPSAHGTGGFEQGVQGSPRDNATAVQRLRPEDMPSAAAAMAQSHMADMPSAHHRRGQSQASPAMSATAPTMPSMMHPPAPEHGAGRLSQDDGRSMSSMTNAMGRASLSGRDSQRTSGTPAQPITPPESYHAPLGIIQDKSGGIRPIGAPELDEVEAADVANMDLKSVYLKGLFSVSTTSTKSARTLLRDISHVLDRVGIKYRPIRGGFECIHVPSIDLASVVHGDEARSSLHVPSQALESTPSKNKLGLHKSDLTGSTTSRGDSPSPAIPQGSSGTVGIIDVNVPSKSVRLDQDDGDAWGLQYGGQSPLAVRFEVFVVKVPWLPLHGIQFRRIGGDGWQYQQLAKTILREMRL